MSVPAHCANCDEPVTDTGQKFCPACGQSTPPRRIDWHFLSTEVANGLFNLDRGITYSIKQLMLRPGQLMRDYLEGRRARQAKPLLLLTITAALVVLVSRYLLVDDVTGTMMSAPKAANPIASGDGETAHIVDALAVVGGWMNRNFATTTLLLLPFEAAAFKLAFRRFKDVNYPEWLVITAFLTVQTFVIWALLIPLQQWIPYHIWVIALSTVYAVFSLMQFFSGYPRWKSALRTLFGLAMFGLLSNLLPASVAVMIALQSRG